ncbi:hypothetical protein [Paenibacillus sp. 481]|uniref:hypothetical protein n=1 Tax=Paenibacillus sp. 481 TaxID=2835869 RepID=UPI001E61D892|nr:hypothetical protein [Paenibacillus sp. 481]UHA73141.1 hypothetical protein KIK04_21510 [Paenibacillus sp. 481]
MKKIKFFTVSTTVVVSLLGQPVSAFVGGNLMKPDTEQSHTFRCIPDSFHGKITNCEKDGDINYFKWTNSTQNGQFFYVNFDTYENRSLNYQIHSIGIGGLSSSVHRITKNIGQEVWAVYLPAGETLSVKIGPENASKYDPNVKYIVNLSKAPWF